MNKLKIGVVGCGDISSHYLTKARSFPILHLVSCADLISDRSAALAQKFGIRKAESVETLLSDPDVDLIMNLTVPKAHASVTLAAIECGKHVWSEKPLAATRRDGRKILAAARTKDVRIGCAPDTFLGAGQQLARRLIDQGAIGQPVSATAFMMSPGSGGGHRNTEMFFQVGAGPMFDFGPYYLTALVNLLGPIRRVTASMAIAWPDRRFRTGPKTGQRINVDTPDHVSGTIEFAGGAIGTILTSFAAWHSPHCHIHVFGTEGTMAVPDPNGFDGPVRLRGASEDEWREIPFEHNMGYGRSAGAADMAHAIRSGRPHRAGLDLAFGVLDAMEGFLDAGTEGKAYQTAARYERPAAVPPGLAAGLFDE